MTFADPGFTETFQRIARAAGWASPPRPAQALAQWEGFVEECEEGYALDFSEYLDDLSVRTLLHKVLGDPEARHGPVYEPFARRVGLVDDRFRALIGEGPLVRPGSDHWWERRIPAAGGPEFVADVHERYAVRLRTLEE
ncbi:hypothetical protein [Streptomyces fumanus]|uniref:Uncharacterized protein n=1 Tax=Streptomyces fumanus TaxID=67302 RepID=A0A919AHA1_9ACTN|nr:hypothetical protein [Streptomyces fumanus]GHF07851.1 hypothetical protein GCM10018772_36130 [Streptomyces fumanus]